MGNTLIATRLDQQTHDLLKCIAQQQDRKVGYLVRKAVEQFVQVADKPRKSVRSAASRATLKEEGG